MVTIVTSLYDIDRERSGDGRLFVDYINWLSETLSLNSNFVVYTESKVVGKIPIRDNIKIVVTDVCDVPLYHMFPRIKSILDTPSYRQKMENINRVECILPMYNVIVYSKFEWLKSAIQYNPFNSTHFFWMDAGCSRFFCGLNKDFPNPKKLPSKFMIQSTVSGYQIDDKYKWKSNSMFMAGFMGGEKSYVTKVSDCVIDFIKSEFLAHQIVNNEQIALAFIVKQHPDLFDVYVRKNNDVLPILKELQ